MLAIQKRAIDMPLALVLSVSGKSSTVQATTHLKPGELMIPLYYQRHNSLYPAVAGGGILSRPGVRRHPHAVVGDVKWPVSEAEKNAGIEDHHIIFFVHPEFKLPSKSTVVADEFDWSKSDAVHPFWGIMRQKADTDM